MEKEVIAISTTTDADRERIRKQAGIDSENLLREIRRMFLTPEGKNILKHVKDVMKLVLKFTKEEDLNKLIDSNKIYLERAYSICLEAEIKKFNNK